MKTIYSIFSSLFLLCLATACSKPVAKPTQPVTVKTDIVVANGQKSFLQYPGRVQAAKDVDLSFRINGQIQKIYVKEGSIVKKGQLLAEMDPTDYQVQLAATEAKYKQIKAEAERVIALYNDGGSTPNDYDKATYGLKQIDALYKHHKDELSYTKLYAPFDGYIQKILFDAHETVAAGMPVVALLSSSTPEVEINLPAAEYIRRDQFCSYHCTFDIYPGMVYPLEFVSINHKANPNQLYSMRLRLNAKEMPMPSAGMNTMVSIFYNDQNDNTLLVPTNAVFNDKGQASVYKYAADTKTVKRCPVKCLRPLTDGHLIITSNALKAGDIIVSAGVNALKDGQQVEPLQPVSKSNIGGLL